MDVLVYDGPGVSKTSLSYTLSTLRTLLLPNYTVQTITPQSLASEPWSASCALLALPGGRDLPYLSALQRSNALIASYVRGGGSFLGICAGAYYACRKVEWEIGSEYEVSGDRPLRFFDGIGRGCVYPGFQYGSESGARAVCLRASESLIGKEETLKGLYYNGGGEFVDAQATPGVMVLARYTEDDGSDKVAGVSCQVGDGTAVLWAIHPEYPLTLEPALSAIAGSGLDLKDRIDQHEENRWRLVKQSLRLLGLSLPAPIDIKTMRPLPQFLTSTPGISSTIKTMSQSLIRDSMDSEPIVLKDSADTFHFHRIAYSSDLVNRIQTSQESDTTVVKHVIVLGEGTPPPKEATRAYNISQYYSDLSDAQKQRNLSSERPQKMGEILLYGEVVTSTQTMLDQNPKLLMHLPVPLLSLATHQLSGRGRGSNTWLSPPGCLQFSLFLRVLSPLSRVQSPCRSSSVLGNFGDKVRLKWPNDIYAVLEGGGVKKIGGILVNTSFTGGIVDIVIGCGLNVLSPSPLTSLSQLIPAGFSDTVISMERTTATIMATFDEMWLQFLSSKGSFEPFLDMYLQRWLHSDQLVKLTTVDPPVMVRIVGITLNHGLLRTMPESRDYMSHRGEEYIDLQPDGNSFDLMAGLIKTKT
ncbi:class II aaRS and biotin synthetase [Phellopilus nigrolimitatus]|nr:class II aaRS and biotin synthetase [Phellopilus nigrolimitatus]